MDLKKKHPYSYNFTHRVRARTKMIKTTITSEVPKRELKTTTTITLLIKIDTRFFKSYGGI